MSKTMARFGITFGIGAALAFAPGCKQETDIIARGTQPGIGAPPAPINTLQEDRILQVNRPAIDVLFVIDNSCSMEEEQVSLSQNFPQFMNYFLGSGLDYHIGVVSTDLVSGLHAGKLQEARGYRYIDENTDDPNAVFAQMAMMGASGHWFERGRDAVFTAIDLRGDDPENRGFYRPEAGLEVIFVSDEDDVSELMSELEFREWFENLKWAPERTNAHAIVGPSNIDTCQEAVGPGYDYLELAEATEGQTFSICEDDWAPMLDRLGLAASGLRLEYFLSKLPVVSTIEVRVRNPEDVSFEYNVCVAGDEIEDDSCEVAYNPARNSVVFLGDEPAPFSEILIGYTIRENFSGVLDDSPEG